MKKRINYIPESISFIEGFLGPKGDKGYTMVADYNKAKKILNKLIDSGRDIITAEMGLDGDWAINSCLIYDGEKHYEYTEWGHSIWATPIMIINFSDSPSETYEVWKKSED